MKKGKYAKVIIDISHENVDRPYTYKIGDDLYEQIDIGSIVYVPFGKGNTERKGVVVDFSEEADFDPSKIKEIIRVSDKDLSLTDNRIRLALWIKKQYGSTLIKALQTVLPVKQKIKKQVKKNVVLLMPEDKVREEIEKTINTRSVARLRMLYALLEEPVIPKKVVSEKLHISDSTLLKLESDGFIALKDEEDKSVLSGHFKNTPKLMEDQKEIVDAISKDMADCRPGKYLIHGITGSGKTEVYMGIIEECIKNGKKAIVLIPEISLTYQTLMRFINRFGNRVTFINSTLSQGEKYEVYEKAKNGDVDIVIGPRSALFVPFSDLGVIIIDEEHEGSYKSENPPRYHAREVAEKIAEMSNAALVLGSATPSVDAYYKAQKGEYRLFKLTRRHTGNQLPNVSICDMREELRKGNRSIISGELQNLIKDRLSKKQQVMLFLNRRGFAGFISCRQCGFVVKCPHCDVSLSLHGNGKLVCHYCGYETFNIHKCPKCDSKYISSFKAGTEQVEETVNKMFPGVRTLRMDRDTTKEKEDYGKIIEKFLNKEADILIGTQMIVKGHDFKNVTLVGVLAADMSLFESDYKASEKTFDLLTQAAGRAGRGSEPGEVVIQTYSPDSYAIVYSAKQDYEGFYEEEAGYREMLDYPPAGHMLSVLCTGKNEEETLKLANMMCLALRKYFDSKVYGPAPSVISKINDCYRFSFYIKNKDYGKLVEIKDYLEENLLKIKNKKANVLFDFDPQDMQ